MRRAASVAARIALPASLLLYLLPLFLLARPARAAPPLPTAPSARQATSAPPPRLPSDINLNAGGGAVGRFRADAPWVVGSTAVFDLSGAVIGGAEDRNLPMYRSHRFGVSDQTAWGYDLPVSDPGLYNCTAHFAETDHESKAVGHRVFDLVFASSATDPTTFANLDVFAAANEAAFTVHTRTVELFPVPGVLSLRLYPRVGNAFLSGLTCVRAADLPTDVAVDYESPPRLPAEPTSLREHAVGPAAPAGAAAAEKAEINVNCGGEAYGRFVADDFAWLVGGDTSQWGGPPNVEIGGVDPRNERAVRSHRYGMDGKPFGYRIPVPNPGVYECTLHFSETDSDAFRVGARVFDVEVMGQRVDNLDVFAATGGAGFTAYVRTFVDLSLTSTLDIDLTPRVENAFISAITCARTAELEDGVAAAAAAPSIDPAADAAASPEPSTPSEDDPSASPTVLPPPAETPTPDTDTAEPSPGASDTADGDAAPSPGAGDATDAAETEASPTPSAPATVPEPGAGVPPGFPPMSPQPSPPPQASVDEKLSPAEGELEHIYELTVSVSGTSPQVFTDGMKDALQEVLAAGAANVTARFALLEVTQTAETRRLGGSSRRVVTMRQGEDDVGLPSTRSEYIIDWQTLYAAKDKDNAVRRVETYVQNGDAARGMGTRGFPNVDVGLRESGVGPVEKAGESAGSNTARIVGGVVGGGLAMLALIAVVVFVYVNRKKENEENEGGFDGPPPDLSESEHSELARSETGASVEFLDDDSTFTAATSRAGEHVDHVEFVKDAFGRGTNAGTHGV